MVTIERYRGVLVEATVLSDSEADGWVVEIWDLTPTTGSELLHVHKHPSGQLTVDLLGNRLEKGFLTWAVELAETKLRDY